MNRSTVRRASAYSRNMEVVKLIKSMTGYGRAVKSFEGREITVELRSVNNRFLDCNIRMPRQFSYTEDHIKQMIKEHISRGKVDMFITINDTAEEQVAISLNKPVVEGYLAAMRMMTEEFSVGGDITVADIARMPDVFSIERPEIDEEARAAEIYDVVSAALEQYDNMRATEGIALKQDLLNRRATILGLVARVEERSPITVAEYRTRLENKLREVLGSSDIDESRILTEAAIFADKVAVDEETVRLRSHLDQLQMMLEEKGSIGRKLDFLLQEMNREANTIGSKGNDIEQARTVVEIKAELEKIREQIQNVE